MNSNGSARFHFEQRAATVLFKIITSPILSGPFLLPANICPIVPLVFLKAGRSFEFIDICPRTLCLDHEAVMARWRRPGTPPAGIVYARSYGAVFKTDQLFSEIKSLSPQALIIDDRCLCPPDFNNIICDHTDAVLYSTGYAKYVDIGFGGFGLLRYKTPYKDTQHSFNPQALKELTKKYKSCLATRTKFSYQDSDWLDTRPPEISWVDYYQRVTQEHKRARKTKELINSIYSTELPYKIKLSNIFQTWRFNIYVEKKEEILKTIQEAGFFASGHYESLTGIFAPGQAPIAEKVYKNIINLFNDRYFDTNKASNLSKLLTSLHLTPPSQF